MECSGRADMLRREFTSENRESVRTNHTAGTLISSLRTQPGQRLGCASTWLTILGGESVIGKDICGYTLIMGDRLHPSGTDQICNIIGVVLYSFDDTGPARLTCTVMQRAKRVLALKCVLHVCGSSTAAGRSASLTHTSLAY